MGEDMKHTKGPWIYEQTESTCNKLDLIIKSQKESIGWVYSDNEANARLISCAPEMLDSLIFEAGLDTGDSGAYQRLKNIIEKATGMKIEEVLK